MLLLFAGELAQILLKLYLNLKHSKGRLLARKHVQDSFGRYYTRENGLWCARTSVPGRVVEWEGATPKNQVRIAVMLLVFATDFAEQRIFTFSVGLNHKYPRLG